MMSLLSNPLRYYLKEEIFLDSISVKYIKLLIYLFYCFLVLVTVIIAVLIFLVYYFYKKFSVTRDILKYEINDVRNLSNIPKSEAELSNIVKDASARKYANLTSDSDNV